jgi:hypothetical protein
VQVKKFSASQAESMIGCHASADLEKAIPGFKLPENDPNREPSIPENIGFIVDMIDKVSTDTGSSKAASRGSMLHACVATLLAEFSTAGKFEMLTELFIRLNHVLQRRRFKMLVEVTALLDWLQRPVPTTADLVLYTADELHVWDWKFGTMPVNVAALQLKIYALAFLHLAPKAKGVWVHVLQPGNYAEVYFDLDQLQAAKDLVLQHEAEVIGGDLTFNTGKQCEFCPASPYTRGAKGNISCTQFITDVVKVRENSKPVDAAAFAEL